MSFYYGFLEQGTERERLPHRSFLSLIIILGLSTQYINNSRKINNFVGAVEAATDIKKENLAIERKLAEGSAAADLPSGQEMTKNSAIMSYFKIAIPWLTFLTIMAIIAYFIISSSVNVA